MTTVKPKPSKAKKIAKAAAKAAAPIVAAAAVSKLTTGKLNLKAAVLDAAAALLARLRGPSAANDNWKAPQ